MCWKYCLLIHTPKLALHTRKAKADFENVIQADYRGTEGTYTLNKKYRPIYYNEFITNHEARKRYWARSFLGWTNLHRARPNVAHMAVRDLGKLGLVNGVITQSKRTTPLQILHGSNIMSRCEVSAVADVVGPF